MLSRAALKRGKTGGKQGQGKVSAQPFQGMRFFIYQLSLVVSGIVLQLVDNSIVMTGEGLQLLDIHRQVSPKLQSLGDINVLIRLRRSNKISRRSLGFDAQNPRDFPV